MKDRARVIGRIQTMRAAERPLGAGWKFDPKIEKYIKKTQSHNMIVLAGLGMMAKSIQYGNADAGKTLRYMGVGAGHAAPSKTDVGLGSEVQRLEVDSWDNTDIASDPVVMIATKLFNATQGNGQLMECGLFVIASGAPMYCRGLFGTGDITDITQANPGVVTCSGHGLTDGDKILIESVGGMTELNDNTYFADSLGNTTFALYADSDLTTPVSTSGYDAYTSGGTFKTVIPKTSAETLTVNYSLTFPAD